VQREEAIDRVAAVIEQASKQMASAMAAMARLQGGR
jgi:hypothetical protein